VQDYDAVIIDLLGFLGNSLNGKKEVHTRGYGFKETPGGFEE
jgi:hypothetical protein